MPEGAREYPTSRRRLAVLLAVTRAIYEAPGMVEAARKVLVALGDSEGWSGGVIWQVSDDGERLLCADVWWPADRPALGLERAACSVRVTRHVGLAGRAWASGRPVFAGDVHRDDELRRDPCFEREGFRAGVAFPIPLGPGHPQSSGNVAGVVELFSRLPREHDPLSEELWSVITAELGRLGRRTSTEQALSRAEARLDLVVGQAPVILFAFDREGRFTVGQGRGLSGIALPNEHVGRSIFELYSDVPDIVAAAHRALAGEAFTTVTELPRGERGRFFETRYQPTFDAHGQVSEVVGVAVDVTERHLAEVALRRSQAQLIEADRLASLGTLAAGVAHEINNPLSYVLLNLDLVIREAAVSAPAAPFAARLREARAGVERVRLIVQDLKSFSRSDTERRVPTDVRRVLDSTIEIAANEIRHRARLIRTYEEVPAVEADASRLGQVFLNLLVNASQAMVEGDASRNEIRVGTRTDAAGHVVVEIADTGAGVAPELLSRIFEPFFTTKPVGVGTGLGLSICRDIVTALGGDITVESTIGAGTTFRVVLPASHAPAAIVDEPTPVPVTSAGQPTVPSSRLRGRVLVVDDEPALASALARSIERDHDVVVLSSGREALELLRRDDAFDVILCDLIMPQVTGMDLYEQLSRQTPALADRIIFMTGGTFTSRAREFLAKVGNPALDKPFDLSTLSALLRARTRR
jgi:signal transduction histidine kinase/CheY-like chemotaxis protein